MTRMQVVEIPDQSPKLDVASTVNTMEASKPIGVKWDNICVKLGAKEILKSITGFASPGEIVAIMGPSGSGKTTLLNTLTGRIHPDAWTGSLTVNQKEFDPQKWGNHRAYVEQRDSVLTALTPREILTFSASLRLEDPGDIVQKTLDLLDLTDCADTQCGDQAKGGISGGQLKRVCIARDLIVNPSVILLDEPTSGLDNYNALKVLQILRRLCDNLKTTVILTIHQPNGAIGLNIDRFVYMHHGEIYCQGTLEEMRKFVSLEGHPCPDYEILTDHLMNLSMEVEPEKLDAWKSKSVDMLISLPESFPSGGLSEAKNWESRFMRQIESLLIRQWYVDIRGDDFIAIFLVPIFISVFSCGIQWDAANSSSYNYQFATVTLVILLGFVTAMLPLKTFISEILIFSAEISTGTYSRNAYFTAKYIAIIIKIFVITVIALVIGYYMLGLKGNFGMLLLWTFVLGYVGSGWVAALGLYAGTMEGAIEVFDAVITPQMMIAWVNLPKSLQWLEYLASMKAAMFLCQLEEANDATLAEWGTAAKRDDYTRYVVILVVHMFLVTALAYWALYYRATILYK